VIVVTGGAGFIGTNVVRALNARGHTDVLIVDELEDGRKLLHLADCEILDVVDRDEFRAALEGGHSLGERVEAVFHQGACADTTRWDGKYVMDTNYAYSRLLFDYCVERQIPLIYASSGAVYGRGPGFREDPEDEAPLNLYGLSKLLFDRYVRARLGRLGSQVVGLRYFNVYGPFEEHKGDMASVAFKLHHQLLRDGRVRLFEGSDGYADGEQRRDFVWVGDVASVNLWFLDHPEVSGVFNVGTGRSQTFNDVAHAVIGFHGRGEIQYLPFPEKLRRRYQSFTEADVAALRAAGYKERFLPVEEGVPRYLRWLQERAAPVLPAAGPAKGARPARRAGPGSAP
jgi:ADP-L-glycero-D-manno-heptose 6-epimerase